MRKDKKTTDTPANYWEGVTSKSMREAGPSIMDKVKADEAKKKPLTPKQLATAPMFEKK